MSNMGYCRFQNTLSDLRDCFEALQDESTLSPEEFSAAERLVELCQDIVDGPAPRNTDDDEDEFEDDADDIFTDDDDED